MDTMYAPDVMMECHLPQNYPPEPCQYNSMICEVITSFYKESFLVPMFLNHYDWSDRITLITQKREDHLFDDEDKMNWVNAAIARSTADWVVLVDCDEFIYPEPYGINPRAILEQETCGVIYAHMTRMWRHVSDSDIDRNRPPVPQRLHGQPDHVKPCVFRPLGGLRVGAGNHDINFELTRGKPWVGSHWANADQCFWVERETRDRGPRLTQRNKDRGHGTHTLRTKGQILAECKAHENDPQIIFLP